MLSVKQATAARKETAARKAELEKRIAELDGKLVNVAANLIAAQNDVKRKQQLEILQRRLEGELDQARRDLETVERGVRAGAAAVEIARTQQSVISAADARIRKHGKQAEVFAAEMEAAFDQLLAAHRKWLDECKAIEQAYVRVGIAGQRSRLDMPLRSAAVGGMVARYTEDTLPWVDSKRPKSQRGDGPSLVDSVKASWPQYLPLDEE